MLFPAVVAVIVFIGFLLILQQRIQSDENRRKKAMLGQLSDNIRSHVRFDENVSVLKEQDFVPVSGVAGIFFKLPGVRSTYELLLKAGLIRRASIYVLSSLLLFFIVAFILRKLILGGIPIGALAAVAVAYLLPRKFLTHKIAKRNQQFLNLFPDAVDMIVRSIRSGHPLNTAMLMIANNMEDPIRGEFKLVVDEVSYGRTLPEALGRMAQRIDEPDLHFFVVVLSVQQETGGSLAEVLTNLSGVIRKRRQLRLKIRSLTSEGRATSYILGALPVVEFSALYYMTPTYMAPLFDSLAGNVILAGAGALIVLAIWTVNIMVDIEI